MRNPESQKLYLDRQKAEFKKSAESRFEFEAGDILVQTGGTGSHPKWFELNPRRYVGIRPHPDPGPFLYSGVCWQLLENNGGTWGWAHTFFHIASRRNYFILEYPSYLRGRCFTKIVGVE